MATRYRQNEDGTLRIVAADGAAEEKKAPNGATERKATSDGGARWRHGLRLSAYAAGFVTTCVTLVIGWDANPLMALCAPALPCLCLFVVMLLYGSHPDVGDDADLDDFLAFAVIWLCLLAAAVVLVSDTETVLAVSCLLNVLLILVLI